MDSTSSKAPVLYFVEDDYDWAYFFSTTFEKSAPDWKIIYARNGLEAQRLLVGAPAPHAVVTDLQMPGMDGFELIEWIKAQAPFQTVPVFVISGSPDPSHRQRCVSLGVDGYIAKPASLKELRAIIHDIVKQCAELRSDGNDPADFRRSDELSTPTPAATESII